MRDFRFSYNVFGIGSRDEFVDTCVRGEELGYDTVFTTDHLGITSPFPPLVLAASVTRRMRVGTLVLNVPFWNPALLAREIATTDVLTDGRLEVGLGAGHMKWEFDAAEIPFASFGQRAEQLRATVEALRADFASEGFPQLAERAAEFDLPHLRPVQRHGFAGHGPPLIIGGTGDRILRLAAEFADVIGVAGVFQVKGESPGTFRLGTAADAGERVRFARECAGARADDVEWHVLAQAVVATDDRQGAAAAMAGRFGDTLSAEEILDTPFLLIGTAAEMADQVLRNRERFGFTYYTVHGPFMEAFAPVVERLS